MSLANLMAKYNLTDRHLDVIAKTLYQDMPLAQAAAHLNGALTEAQFYLVARQFCLSTFGLPITDVAPVMAADRNELNDPVRNLWQEANEHKREVKRLAAMEEDLSLTLQEKLAARAS